MRRYTFKIYPQGGARAVFRTIGFDGDTKLSKLADEILDAFEFDHDHMYEFCMSGRIYDRNGLNYVMDRGIGYGIPMNRMTIDRLKLSKGQKFLFHYDFGDDWVFVIHVQKITEVESASAPALKAEKGFLEQYPDYDDEWDEEWEEGEDEEE